MKSPTLMILTGFSSALSFYNTLWLSVFYAKLYLAGSADNSLRMLTAIGASFSFLLLVTQLVIFCRELCRMLADDK